MAARDDLLAVLKAYALQVGEFQLSSGGTSQWYLDARQVTFRGDCVELVGRAIVERLSAEAEITFDAVGGMTLGADPVAVAVALVTGVRAFSVRKEAKGHGVGGRMAGPVRAGDRVLVVEDSVSTGASLLRAVEAIEAFGCDIVAAACLLDRGGVLGAELATRGVPFYAVLGAPDLGFDFGS
jgi:orotate phosphoribosyltransferase